MKKVITIILFIMAMLISGCGKHSGNYNSKTGLKSAEIIPVLTCQISNKAAIEKNIQLTTEEIIEETTEESIDSANTNSGIDDSGNQNKIDSVDSNFNIANSRDNNTGISDSNVYNNQTIIETDIQVETPQDEIISYNPQNVVALATAKVKAGGKTTLTDDLDSLLVEGRITNEEYNSYYPYDGAGYYSVFVDSNLAEARDVSGTKHFTCEDDIAEYIAEMLLLERGDLFLIEYAGTYDYYGKICYEFRCYRA